MNEPKPDPFTSIYDVQTGQSAGFTPKPQPAPLAEPAHKKIVHFWDDPTMGTVCGLTNALWITYIPANVTCPTCLASVAEPAQPTVPENPNSDKHHAAVKDEELCARCNHAAWHHYHGKGVCNTENGTGHRCNCSRFVKPKAAEPAQGERWVFETLEEDGKWVVRFESDEATARAAYDAVRHSISPFRGVQIRSLREPMLHSLNHSSKGKNSITPTVAPSQPKPTEYSRESTCAHCSRDMNRRPDERCSNGGLCVSIEEFDEAKSKLEPSRETEKAGDTENPRLTAFREYRSKKAEPLAEPKLEELPALPESVLEEMRLLHNRYDALSATQIALAAREDQIRALRGERDRLLTGVGRAIGIQCSDIDALIDEVGCAVDRQEK